MAPVVRAPVVRAPVPRVLLVQVGEIGVPAGILEQRAVIPAGFALLVPAPASSALGRA
jgi:hypothetical protein